MEAKNLPLKFAFVVLLVAVCLWSLFLGGGLKQGIDLRGGHSLIFEVRTDQPEIQRLEQVIRDETDQLAAAKKAGDSEKIKQLTQSIERDRHELETLRRRQQTRGDLVQRVIRILKERIDPQGLRSLEWRPLGENRFEVRMPAGSKETQQAKEAFRRAMDDLAAENVTRSDILRLVRAEGEQRQAVLERLANKAPDQVERLRQVAAAYDRMTAAEEKEKVLAERIAGAAGEVPGDLQTAYNEAVDAYVAAKSAYQNRYQAVLDANIDPQRLQTILSNYVGATEAEVLAKRKEGREQMERRRERLAEQLAELRKEHPAETDQINRIVALYKDWADVRQRLEDPSDLKRLIAKAGVLEFRIAPGVPEELGGRQEIQYRLTSEEYDRYVSVLREKGPEVLRRQHADYQWFPVREGEDLAGGLVTAGYAGKEYVLLCNQPNRVLLRERRGGWELTSARQDVDRFGRLAVAFRLNEPGARRMQKLTSPNVDNFMAILLDDEVYSAPMIEEAIAGRGQITGSFTRAEIEDLVRTLEAGSLPARVNPDPVAENTFGPSLGEVNRRMGIRAAYWGLIAVAVFMLVYYLLCGLIANVALMLNIILVLGTMSLLSAVFTLPGIAGVILTIGIAVDANVLIFERLREEQAKGQSMRMALKNAYDRAFSAIFDANVTTLITCMILAWIGTEEVRGFGITLGLGVAFSLFCALAVTRWIFQLLLSRRWLKHQIFMLRLVPVPKINWMSKRYAFWGLSVALVVMGALSILWQGGDLLGIEFSAGTQATVQFREDAMIGDELPNDGLVSRLFVAQAQQMRGENPRYGQLADTARVEKQIAPDRTTTFLRDYDTSADGQVDRAEWDAHGGNEAFFAKVDANSDGRLTREELNAHLPATSYQVSTTVTDLSLIRETARRAFGRQLAQMTACDFKLARGGRAEALGIPLAEDGLTRVTAQPDSPYWDLFEDFKGGVVMVVEDVTPPLTEAQLGSRIRDMRYQPDFGGQLRPTKVIGLTGAGKEGFSRFAVFVRPDDPTIGDRPEAWRDFANSERELLTAALERDEAMLATNFDAAIAGEAVQRAIFAVVLSWLAIVVYVWLRFGSVRWGLAAVVCLVHDVVIVVGLVAASGWLAQTLVGKALMIGSFKIDLAMVAAMLTVIGYSVNDTIVVFDRIRENRGKLTAVSGETINASINQVLPRTLLTSFTTFLVVLIMYVAGGPGIHAFNYALLAGILFGTYSSVAVASPLLMGFKRALVAKIAPARQ